MTAREQKAFFRKVLWFENKVRFDIDFFDLLVPRRTVSDNPRYKSGRYRSAKCGRDIQYESALELRFVELLEHCPHVVFYWDQPVRIPFRRGRRKLLYTPDYGICLDTGHVVLAEVKELTEMLDYRVEQKTEALMAFCRKRGFGLLLTDGRHTPRQLLEGRVNRRLEKELAAALQSGPLRGAPCRDLLARCHATHAELCRTAIRMHLNFRPFPLKLQYGRQPSLFRQVFFEGGNYDQLTAAQ